MQNNTFSYLHPSDTVEGYIDHLRSRWPSSWSDGMIPCINAEVGPHLGEGVRTNSVFFFTAQRGGWDGEHNNLLLEVVIVPSHSWLGGPDNVIVRLYFDSFALRRGEVRGEVSQ